MLYSKKHNQSKKSTFRGIGWLILGGFLILGSSLAAARVKNQPGQISGSSKSAVPQVIKSVLPNGLTLLFKPNLANEVVVVNLYVKSGPLYEELSQRGISSLTQKVLIRGSQSRTAREIAAETESVGAQISAGVAGDYGYVSLLTTVAGLDKGLEVFLDLLRDPAFTDSEIEKEKQMLIESLAAREDQPFNAAYLCFTRNFYSGHPLGVATADLISSIRKLTRRDLLDWYKRTYVPNNMVISTVGKIDPVSLRQKFQAALGKLAPGKTLPLITSSVKPPTENRVEYLKKDTNALFLVLGYPAPDLNSKDALVMNVINRILGGGSDSRLYLELREKRGLAYSVYTGYNKMSQNSHIYAIMATAPDNWSEARDGIVKEFKRLTTETVSAKALTMAKQAICGSFLMSHETNEAQSSLLGRFELLGLGHEYDQQYPKLIRQVTAADIKRVARKYFSYYTLGVVTANPPESGN